MRIRNILLTTLAILGLALLASPGTEAQTCNGGGKNFVDLNGDGFNDNAPDLDGDGIPNGLDPDYVKSAGVGTGYQNGKLGANKEQGTVNKQTRTRAQKFTRLQSATGEVSRNRVGAKNGSAAGVCNGTGQGTGTGVCDGTGPHGTQKRGGK